MRKHFGFTKFSTYLTCSAELIAWQKLRKLCEVKKENFYVCTTADLAHYSKMRFNFVLRFSNVLSKAVFKVGQCSGAWKTHFRQTTRIMHQTACWVKLLKFQNVSKGRLGWKKNTTQWTTQSFHALLSKVMQAFFGHFSFEKIFSTDKQHTIL